MSELIDRLDTSLNQIALRTAADLGHEHRMTIIDGADNRLETVFLAIAALAIKIDTAMTDKLCTSRRKLPDLELLGMAKVLIDESGTLRRHGGEKLDVAHFTGKCRKLFLFRRDLSDPLLFDLGLISLSRVEIVVHVHCHDLVGREFRAAVFAQEAHRISAALPAVAHHIHLAFTAILERLQLLSRGTPLTRKAKHRAMLRRGDKRHDIVEECTTRFNCFVDLDEMPVVDAGDHD